MQSVSNVADVKRIPSSKRNDECIQQCMSVLSTTYIEDHSNVVHLWAEDILPDVEISSETKSGRKLKNLKKKMMKKEEGGDINQDKFSLESDDDGKLGGKMSSPKRNTGRSFNVKPERVETTDLKSDEKAEFKSTQRGRK